MNASHLPALAFAALILVTGASPAGAQPRAPRRIDPILVPIVPLPIGLPCCRCVDGSAIPVDVHTAPGSGWTVSSPGASTAQPVAQTSNAAWASVAPAQWVAPPGNPTAGGNYTYQLAFEVPACVIPATITVAGRFAADNRATLFVDSNQIAATPGTTTHGFLPGNIVTFSATVPANASGQHVLRLVVNNVSNVTGAAVQATITLQCPDDPLASPAAAQRRR